MRVLFVGSYNKGFFSAFIYEQAEALKRQGVEVDYFGVVGHGVLGYLHVLGDLKQKIKKFQPDIIHAHYGLSGLLSNLQRRVPVVTTYHGSDINEKKVRRISRLSVLLSKWNIFVSQKNVDMIRPKRHFSLLPCGIDLTDDQLITTEEARKMLGWSANRVAFLFSSSFVTKVKNYPLAREAVEKYMADTATDAELIELVNMNRQEVNLRMCAVNALLLTSFREGSPQVIKEAMACGCPIVAVDVGDVKERTSGVEGCFIVEPKADQIADALKKAVAFQGKTKGRERIIELGLDNQHIAGQLVEIYKQVLK